MDSYLGEIRLFAGNPQRVPAGWHVCDGSVVSVNTYQALFAVLGTTYGGDGVTTFGLPDLRGRVPIGAGSGPGLTPRALASYGGTETVTLTEAQLPAHTHSFSATKSAASTLMPKANMLGDVTGVTANLQINPSPGQINIYQDPVTSALVTLNAGAMTTASGGNQSHNNVMPSAVITAIICLNGIFPTPN